MSTNLNAMAAPVRDRVSSEEWQTRVDLAAAYQLGAVHKWTDLIYTHFSARVPGTHDFLINPFGLMFDEITASSLVKVNLGGEVLDDPLQMGINRAGFVIHSCIHRARPEVNCVIHTHTRAGVAVSAMKCGLLPISQHAMMVQADVTYHDFEGVALYEEEQVRMARNLGSSCNAMILRNHGLLALGHTVGDAVNVMHYLECACQIQIDAMAGGLDNVQRMSEQAAKTASAQFKQFKRERHPVIDKDWKAQKRLLDRRGVRYSD
jgi:ribulose-5-phosphate 4-epimerase/fuculose-1-phosphate aldolase